MVAAKSSRVNRQYKTKYRIRNWREYERGLRSRGDVTIWLSEDAIAAWVPSGLATRPRAPRPDPPFPFVNSVAPRIDPEPSRARSGGAYP